MSEKIRPHHLGRKAVLYVRQSSPHQVLHNRESRTLQYAMRDRLTALGWAEIETVDDDLGRSAAGGPNKCWPRPCDLATSSSWTICQPTKSPASEKPSKPRVPSSSTRR